MSKVNNNIRLAEISDTQVILNIFSACSKKMNDQGLFNWDHSYPDKKTVRKDIERNELWLYGFERIIGVITLTTSQPSEYSKLHWKNDTKNHIVVRRLAVHPDFQGQGIALYLMKFSELHAKNQGALSIRLDVNKKSASVIRLYEKLNYLSIESFHYSDFNTLFIAMEKSIE